MTNCWPSRCDSHCPIRRARMSVVLPAAKPTTMRTGCAGKLCAHAGRNAAGSRAAPAPRWRNLRRERLMMSSVRFPRNDDALELVEGEREQEADDRDHEQPDIHLLYRERAPGAPDQVTQPALSADHFGDRDQHEPDADAQLEPGHDHRQGARKRNGPECAPAARLVVSSDIQIDLVDLEDAGG